MTMFERRRQNKKKNEINHSCDSFYFCVIWVRSRNCGCLVTWFCYQLIAKPGNKTATVSWPEPYTSAHKTAFSIYPASFICKTSSYGRAVSVNGISREPLWQVPYGWGHCTKSDQCILCAPGRLFFLYLSHTKLRLQRSEFFLYLLHIKLRLKRSDVYLFGTIEDFNQVCHFNMR